MNKFLLEIYLNLLEMDYVNQRIRAKLLNENGGNTLVFNRELDFYGGLKADPIESWEKAGKLIVKIVRHMKSLKIPVKEAK